MTQHQMIVDYMKKHGSISPMEAFSQLGITKLSTRIGELARGGKPISRQMETGQNRNGDTVRYMRYRLTEGDLHG